MAKKPRARAQARDGLAPEKNEATGAGKGKDATQEVNEPGPIAVAFEGVLAAKEFPPPAKLPQGDELAQLGIPAFATIDVALLFKAPPKNPPAVDSMEDLIAKTPQVVASDLLATKQAQLNVTKSILASIPDPDHPLHQAATAMLPQQEAEVSKLLKQTPATKVQIEQLKTARQSQVQARTAWEQKEASGKEKAAARMARQLDHIDKMVAELTARKAAITQQAGINEQAWATHHALRASSWDAMFAKFDTRIAELELAAAQPPPPTSPAPPVASQGQALAVVDPLQAAQ